MPNIPGSTPSVLGESTGARIVSPLTSTLLQSQPEDSNKMCYDHMCSG